MSQKLVAVFAKKIKFGQIAFVIFDEPVANWHECKESNLLSRFGSWLLSQEHTGNRKTVSGRSWTLEGVGPLSIVSQTGTLNCVQPGQRFDGIANWNAQPCSPFFLAV